MAWKNGMNKRSKAKRFWKKRSGDGFSKANQSVSTFRRGIPNGYQTAGTVMKRLRFSFNNGHGHGINSTTGGLTTYTYRINSCYDPYYSTGGGQPDGFTHFMANYTKYCVVGAKALVNFAAYSLNFPMVVGCMLSYSPTAPTILSASDSLLAKNRVIDVQNRQKTIKSHWSYKMTGARSVHDGDGIEGTVSSNPSQVWYLHIYGFAVNSQTTDCWFTGHIDMLTLFSDPKMINR